MQVLFLQKAILQQSYNICVCRHIIACWTILMLHQFYTLSGTAKPFFGLVIRLFNFIRSSILS